MAATRPAVPEPPAGPSLSASFRVHQAPVAWAHALVGALSVGGPLLAGAVLDRPSAGIVASLGGFTGQYALDVPYRRRAVLLVWIGFGFVVTAIVSTAAASVVIVAAVGLGAIAALATFLCRALGVGPPAAFLFILVGTIAMSIPADSLAYRAALVALGGGWAWLVAMSGWLVRRRGPEIAALAAAYQRTADFLAAAGTPGLDAARRRAGLALQSSRLTLTAAVGGGTRDPALARLVVLARQANALFLAGVALTQEGGGPLRSELVAAVNGVAEGITNPATARRLQVPEPLLDTAARRQVRDALAAAVTTAAQTSVDPRLVPAPPRRPAPHQLLRASATWESVAVPTAARIGIVVSTAMLLAGALRVDNGSWVALTAAAVQGGNVVVTTQRTLQRAAGTLGGVVVGAVLLTLELTMVGVAWVVMALQFGFRLVVERSYALGTFMLTPVALLLAWTGSGAAPATLAGTRLLDTALGSAIGLAGSVVLWPRFAAARVPAALSRTVEAQGLLVELVVSGRARDDVHGWLRARGRVRSESLNLHAIYDSAAGERLPSGSILERGWPAVIAVDRLGYLIEALPRERPSSRPPTDEVQNVATGFKLLAAAARTGSTPPPVDLPAIVAEPSIATEVTELRQALAAIASSRDYDSPGGPPSCGGGGAGGPKGQRPHTA